MDVKHEGVAVIILAAGKGKRMKSPMAKVLHAVAGLPMILHVVDTAVDVAGGNIVVVVGNQAETVMETVSARADVLFAIQLEQLGTGHAVQCALPVVPAACSVVVILCGDVPLIKPGTIRRLIHEHFRNENEVTLLAVLVDDPFGYGRVICNSSGNVDAIVEESDATADQKRIDLINSGIYCVNRRFLEIALSGIRACNAQQEIYLTDIVAIARTAGQKIGLLTLADPSEVIGINTIQDLQQAEAMMGAT